MGRGEEVLRQGEKRQRERHRERERTGLPDPGQGRKTEGEAPSPLTQGPREAAREGGGQQGPENLRECVERTRPGGQVGHAGKTDRER